MGKLGRFACIFVPMGLSIASLVCLIFVWLGNTSTSGTASSLYFFKADTSGFTTNPDAISGTNYDQLLLNALDASTKANKLKDFYTVGLWNYCSGSIDSNSGVETLHYCSPRQRNYWFNPVDVWGLQNDAADNVFGNDLQKPLDAYQKIAGWMFTAYAVAFFVTVLEIIVGFFALFSRWGSFVTTIVSGVSSFFVLAASITATAMYGALVGGFHTVLSPYHIDASLGGRMLTVTWLTCAFSVGAGLFWLFSVCCCSGKSSSPAHRSRNTAYQGTAAEKTPYSYEPVSAPLGGHAARSAPVKDTSYAGPYEPYRQV
jgi:hypothetical protein